MAWALCGLVLRGTHPRLSGSLAWAVLALGVNLGFQLSRQHYRLIGFRDALRIAMATATLLILTLFLGLLSRDTPVPLDLGVAVSSALTTGGMWMTLRAILRARSEQILGLSKLGQNAPPEGVVMRRSLIVGAGRAGLMIVQELRRHPELGIQVMGFVDDALDKQGIRLQGIPVMGPSRMLRQLIEDHEVTQVVLAIPSAPGTVIRQLADVARSAEVQVKTVPGLFNLLGSRGWKPELKDISIEDLLRREPVHLDQSSLSLVLEDSVVLITGGGGSIGGELARQAAAFRPARIILLGRGENSLWTVERSLRSEFPNQGLSLELCDIRNTARLQQVFERWRPRVVLHAAAHKHVPYLEAHPEEAVENNILGTLNVLRAAESVNSHTFVNISTDKAVNPTNVLGATKRIAEYLVLRAARRTTDGSRYVSVRFGNVLGSRGSVIPIFQEQIRTGGPLTVTHPDMTRYFMTIPEASQLVLQAGVLGDTAKVYVLDMGAPVRIVDLAADMARLSGLIPGRDIDIEFTGIRPGEKLFEELFSMHEDRCSEVHPKVFNADPEDMDDDLIEEGVAALRLAALEKDGVRLQRLVPSYAPAPTGLGRHGGESKDRRVSGSHPIWVSPAQQT
jgi:FlaA1/EpsC-like NDP-sugar epimerase